MSTDETIISILLGFFAFLIVLIIIMIIFYILQAIGLFKIAKREGRGDLAWLAWIPIANTFLLTLLLEQAVHEDIRGKLTLIYGISYAVSIVLSGFIPFVGFIPLILFFYVFYFLAKRYSPNPVIHLVIGIITFSFSTAISIFMFRNKEVVDSTGLNDIAAAE